MAKNPTRVISNNHVDARGSCNIVYPSETHIVLKSCGNLFVHYLLLHYPFFKFLPEQGADTAVFVQN